MSKCVTCGDEKFPEFQEWAMSNDWRASRFSEEYKSKAIANLEKTLEVLQNDNYSILRWKIEDTLLDSKYGDTL